MLSSAGGSDPQPRPRRLSVPALTAAWGILLLAAAGATAEPPAAFRIYVAKSGVYRVTYEELQLAGLGPGVVDSRSLALTWGGEEVPIRVDDGGDGFGPGDRIELVGHHLPGHRSHYSEYSLLNVYRLTVGGSGGGRMSAPPIPADGGSVPPANLAFEEHLERNRLKERFASPGEQAAEVWFWARLTHVDPEPFRQSLRLRRYLQDPRRPVTLAVELMGWSTAARGIEGLYDHRVEVTLNGALVGAGEWDGETHHRIEMQVPAERVRSGNNVFELRVPVRRPPAVEADPAANPIVDAVTLNWIEVRYPRGPRIGSAPVRLVLETTAGGPARVQLTTDGTPLGVYGTGGARFDSGNMEIEERDGDTIYDLYPPPGESVLWAVPEGALHAPVAVELDHPSDLRDPARRADYIMIVHPRLLPAIEPLATFHRRRGLEVAVVGVDDVYDEFSHSILDPGALRDFLSYAYHHWRRPAPRFVLLVGDAGWKPERSVFATELAPGATETRRNLVPTGVFDSHRGLAASDNTFVAVAGDDDLPDMAIGRFPATEPEEVAAMVEKTLRYAAGTAAGPWRRRILWISSGDPFLRERSDAALGSAVTERGFELRKLYPALDVEANEQSQEGLQQALDRGQLLVHFLGHGGRFVWRTGKVDPETKLDLFSVDHLEELTANERLPLFLSMTCYTASFDHPTADSFGERLLRLEGRGAVAFLGASWKISVVSRFSELLLEELTSGGTIGEAVMRAKRRVLSPSVVGIYNLLGDPALELAVPELEVEVTARIGDGGRWEIDAAMPGAGFAGRAIVDWLDGAGRVVRSDELEVAGAALTAAGPALSEVEAVRVFVWNEAGVDGMGAVRLGR